MIPTPAQELMPSSLQDTHQLPAAAPALAAGALQSSAPVCSAQLSPAPACPAAASQSSVATVGAVHCCSYAWFASSRASSSSGSRQKKESTITSQGSERGMTP